MIEVDKTSKLLKIETELNFFEPIIIENLSSDFK